MENIKLNFISLINIFKEFISKEKHLKSNELYMKLKENNISSLTSFFYNDSFWVTIFEKGNFKNDIKHFQNEFIQILYSNLTNSTLFINLIYNIFFLKMERFFDSFYFQRFIFSEFNISLTNKQTNELINYLVTLKIIQNNLNEYKIILNINYYFYENFMKIKTTNKNGIYQNILIAIDKIYEKDEISKKVIIGKLKGWSDSLISTNLNLERIFLKKVFQEFIHKKNINCVENKFIKYLQYNELSFVNFTKFIDLSWESYNFILFKLDEKIELKKQKNDANEFERWLDLEKIEITNKQYFDINQWIFFVKEQNYFFSKNIDLLELRINNHTLEEIGEKFKITRERVRQKISNLIGCMPYLKEMEFLNIFDKYELTVDTFTKITNLPAQSFGLMFLLSKVSKNIKLKEFNIIDENFIDEKIKNDILQSSQKIESDGEIIENKRLSLCLHILKKENSKLHISMIEKKFKDNYKEISSRNWGTRLLVNALTKSEKILAMPNFAFRYFDINPIYESFKEEIDKMLSNIKGVYSTKYFLDKNKGLMHDIGILNEYELHNFLKKTIKNDEIIFSRMPTIFFGYKNRRDFYLDILKDLSPINYKEFCNYLSKNYGHKLLNLYSNTQEEIAEFYSDGILSIEDKSIPSLKLTIEFLDNFKNKIMFTRIEINEIFKNYEIDEKYINSLNLKKIGFNLNKNYAIKKDTTISKEIQKKIKNIGVYTNEFTKYSQVDGQDYLMYNTENFDVIQLEKDKFISIDYFQERTKISKFSILTEIEMIEKCLENNYEIIGLQKIKEILPNLQIFDGSIGDFCLNKLISKSKKIKTFFYVDFYLFSHIEKNIDINYVIESIIISSNFIYKDELLKILRAKICENLSINWLEKRNEHLVNVFYCKELGKYYKNKDIYLEEIYSRD